MQLTEHLTLSQFDQLAGYDFPAEPYPPEWVTSRAIPLATVLEAVCSELGNPRLTVTSGYRSRAFNEALRAAGHPVAENSQHCEGLAADVVFSGVRPIEAFAAALGLHLRGKIRLGGLGLYASWVHLDIRSGPLAQWFGPGSIR
jgi:zinc D-Ala-D-Ala carboxypeptidase